MTLVNQKWLSKLPLRFEKGDKFANVDAEKNSSLYKFPEIPNATPE